MQDKIKIPYITIGISESSGLVRVSTFKFYWFIGHFGYAFNLFTLNQGTFELSNKFNKKCNYYNVKNKEQLKHIYRDIKALIKKLKKTTINLISIYNAANKGLFAPLLRG